MKDRPLAKFARTERRPGLTRRRFVTQLAGAAGVSLAGGTLLNAPSSPAGAAPPAAGWQPGCYTRPFDKFDYRTALDAIAEAGFKYAGIMTAKGPSWLVITIKTTPEEAAQIGSEVKKRGLTNLSLYAGDFPVAESLAAGIDGLKKLVDLCKACGAPNLMLGGVGNEKLYDSYFKVVAECCPYAAEKGIGLSMKPHGGLNATGPQCRKAVEKVAHQNFRIWYDPGNIFYYSDGKLDPVEDAATVDGLVVGMSVKDFRPPKDVMVTPGTGRVDFARVCARLKQGGFGHGPLLVECLEQGEMPHVIGEARRARLFLEDLVRTL